MFKNKFNSASYTAIVIIVFSIIFTLEGLRKDHLISQFGTIGVTFVPIIYAVILTLLK